MRGVIPAGGCPQAGMCLVSLKKGRRPAGDGPRGSAQEAVGGRPCVGFYPEGTGGHCRALSRKCETVSSIF